jgi:hypothetical protein
LTAPALDFPEKASRQDLTITIRAVVDGFPIELCYTGSVEQLLAVTKKLRDLGATPTIAPAYTAPLSGGTQAARKPAQRVEPVYQPDGTACCPVHHKPLAEGRYGLYCPSRATGDQAANDKGYCSPKFD